MLTPQVKLLHKVAILDSNGSVLLLRRSEQSHSRPNKWDLPGGNVEWPDEDAPNISLTGVRENLHGADVSREILEETGLEIAPSEFVTPRYFQTFFDQEKRVYTIVVGWKTRLPAANDTLAIKLSDEHSEYRWAGLAEANTFDYGFAGGDFGFIYRIITNAYENN